MSESSVASGVRRIEAITGRAAIQEFQNLDGLLKKLASELKTEPSEVIEKIGRINTKVRDLEKEIVELKKKLATGAVGSDYMESVKEINGVKLLPFEVDIDDSKAFREFSDQVMQRLGSGVAVLGTASGDKVSLIVRVSKDLTDRYKAGEIIKPLAELVGGRGGGRPDMAQAGGSKVDGLKQALEHSQTLL